jgi:hypothetical protein
LKRDKKYEEVIFFVTNFGDTTIAESLAIACIGIYCTLRPGIFEYMRDRLECELKVTHSIMTKGTNLQIALVLATDTALIAGIFLIGLIVISNVHGQSEIAALPTNSTIPDPTQIMHGETFDDGSGPRRIYIAFATIINPQNITIEVSPDQGTVWDNVNLTNARLIIENVQ